MINSLIFILSLLATTSAQNQTSPQTTPAPQLTSLAATVSPATGKTIYLRNQVILKTPIVISVVAGMQCLDPDAPCLYSNGLGLGTHDLAAVPIAMNDIKNNQTSYPDFQDMQVKFFDAGGSQLRSIEAMSNASNVAPLAIIGPQDYCTVEPGIAGMDDRFLISYRCSGRQTLQDSTAITTYGTFNVFAQLRSSYSDIANGMVSFIKLYNWDRVVVVYSGDGSQKSLIQLDTLAKALGAGGISIVQSYQLENTILDEIVPFATSTRMKYVEIIIETYLSTKAYIVMSNAIGAAETFFFSQAMARLGLLQTGEYVVMSSVGPDNDCLYDGAPNTADIWLTYPLSPPKPYDDALLAYPSVTEMYQNYRSEAFFIESKPLANSPSWQRFRTLVQNVWKNPPCPLMCSFPLLPFGFPCPDTYVALETGLLYDAMITYATAVEEMIVSNVTDPHLGDAMVLQLGERTIHSVTGLDVFVDSFGNPIGNITILSAMRPNDSLKFGLYPVAQFQLNNTEQGMATSFHFLSKQGMNWLNENPPPPKPRCDFKGDKCTSWKDFTTQIVAGGLSVMVVMGLVAGALMYRQWRFERQLQSLFWKIATEDVILQDLSEHLTSMRSMGSATIGSMGSQATVRMQKSRVELRDYEQQLIRDIKERQKQDAKLKAEQQQNPPKKVNFHTLIHQNNQKRGDIATQEYQKKLWAEMDNFGVATHKGHLVALKKLYKPQVEFSRSIRKELKNLIEVKHEHVNALEGLVYDPPRIYLVSEFRQRGCLKDILENEDIQIDSIFLSSMIFDLIKGLAFIHHSSFRCHGKLKSTNCLLDARWVLRLSGFGGTSLRQDEERGLSEEERCRKLLWTAPELIRDAVARLKGTQKGDVYAFGIILHEMYGRKGPFGDELLNPVDVVHMVSHAKPGQPPYRPDMSVLEGVPSYSELCMQQCWDESPEARPNIDGVKKKLHPLTKGLKASVMENMLTMMERYSTNLEHIVADRTHQLQEERKRTERILLQMLPRTVAESLKRGQSVDPERYECATIYFSDIAGFTAMSSQSTPEQVVAFLNDLYTCFDAIINNYDVYKVETIGDAYMVVSGLPIRNGENHAGEIASMSLSLLDATNRFKIRHRPTDILKLRIGIHSGPCVAGVVGLKMPRYCLFGETISKASKMEQTGEALKIHCSAECKEVLDKLRGYDIVQRGAVELKPNEEEITFWVVNEDLDQRQVRIEHESLKYPTLKKNHRR